MKRIYFLLVSFCLLLSCGDGTTPLFEMNVEADLLIPAGLNNLETHYFTLRDVPTRIDLYSNNTTSPIDRIQASNATLEGRIFDLDYSIVDQITIHVISNTDPTEKKEIFYNNIIPFSEESNLRLFSSLSNVEPMLTEEFVDLEVRIVFRTFTPREMDTRIIMSFNAYATE